MMHYSLNQRTLNHRFVLDRNRDHVCRPNNHVRSLQDMSVRYSVTKKSPSGEITKFPLSNYSSNGNIPVSRYTLSKSLYAYI